MGPRAAVALSACFVILSAVLLDRLIFDWAIFQPANHSGWDDFRWYNFQYQTERLIKTYSAGGRGSQPPERAKPLVLVVGSSIAEYSVQKTALERELEKAGRPADVELLVHASMLPMDLRHYAPRINRIAPDVILYITNPADLELERYLPPWEAGPQYDEEQEVAYMGMRLPMLIFYPGVFAAEAPGLSVERRLGLWMRAVSGGLRMRYDWMDPILFSRRAESGPVKSYLNYQGVEIVPGLWREGLSGSCFELPSELLRGVFEIPHALLAQGRVTFSIYDASESLIKDGRCVEPRNKTALFKVTPVAPGWREIFHEARSLPPKVHVRLSHVSSFDGNVIPVEGGAEVTLGRGIRFPGNFGLSKPRDNDYYVRRRSLEDQRLNALSESEYRRDFDRRIQPDDWRSKERFALWQLNKLRLAKYYTRWIAFSEIPQARELRRFTRDTRPSRLVVINNPEHPETLSEYGDSAWYAGYLKFMQSLSQDPRVTFVDLSRMGDKVRFTDSHHLTYDGMDRMSPVYAKALAPLLAGRPHP
ncbi:MAG: hypothetical protein HY042_08860 [Spirochaetia bacterium]|nr:hypothetical protein [Spirochaetia bacterium]